MPNSRQRLFLPKRQGVRGLGGWLRMGQVPASPDRYTLFWPGQESSFDAPDLGRAAVIAIETANKLGVGVHDMRLQKGEEIIDHVAVARSVMEGGAR